jgi:FkbM family methyltransferase
MKPFFKKFFNPHSLVYKLLQQVYHYRHWHPKTCNEDIIQKYSHYKNNVTFIQIGSNNGKHGDPLYDSILTKKWQGILIEPIPYLFEELKKNYVENKDNLIFENSAIAHERGQLKFYRLQRSNLPNLPRWYEQLGAFNKEVVMKHRESIPSFDDLLVEDTVNAITFDDLLQKYTLPKVNLIHIDTEGYDFEILKMIPFASLNVELVMFEHIHLSDSDYKRAIRLMKKNGFKLCVKKRDTIALKKGLSLF